MISTRDAYFDEDYVFSNGLQFAFGITSYDDNRESIEDPSIGTIIAAYKSWGFNEENASNFEQLPMRPCTASELKIGTSQDDGDQLEQLLKM